MITQAAAKRELAKRKIKALLAKPIDLDPRFPAQNAFVSDTARFIDAQCSRRAGKTNGLGLRFVNTMAKYPKSQCLYLAMTFDSAKEIMLPALHELNDKYSLGLEFFEKKIVHPNGAKLLLMGADQKNFIKRIKGRKYPGVAIDEAQDFGMHLQSLIDDVLTPSISDYEDGWLALTGTPGPVPQGYFFDVTHNRKYGFSHHAWTLLDNPFMPNPQKFIADLMAKREWDENHPTLLREYRNKWVLDVQSLWIRYKEGLNHFDKLPPGKYTYVLGIDLGFKDADALAVLAWSDASPTTYLVEEMVTSKQGITELVGQIEHLRKKYDISKMVIDAGGLGKKIAEEIRKRHAIPVVDVDKTKKQETVEFLNDALRLGKFKASKDSQFAKDSYLVQVDWDKSTPDRIVIKKKPHSDVIDAVIYAFKESYYYTHREEPKKPKYGTKEWAESQQDEMWDAAQEHFQKEAEILQNMQQSWSFEQE